MPAKKSGATARPDGSAAPKTRRVYLNEYTRGHIAYLRQVWGLGTWNEAVACLLRRCVETGTLTPDWVASLDPSKIAGTSAATARNLCRVPVSIDAALLRAFDATAKREGLGLSPAAAVALALDWNAVRARFSHFITTRKGASA